MRFVTNLFFVCSMALLCSCDSSEDRDSAKLRVINLSPDTSAIDLLDDGSEFFDNVRYGEASVYDKIQADNHQIQVKLHNAFTTFFDGNVSFEFETDYTMFLFGFADDSSTDMVADDNDKAQSGRVKLRAINGAPSSDGVDIYIVNANQTILDAMPALTDERFREISDYLDSEDGDYRVVVTETGTKNVLASVDFAAESKAVYSMVFIDSPAGGAPFQAKVFKD